MGLARDTPPGADASQDANRVDPVPDWIDDMMAEGVPVPQAAVVDARAEGMPPGEEPEGLPDAQAEADDAFGPEQLPEGWGEDIQRNRMDDMLWRHWGLGYEFVEDHKAELMNLFRESLHQKTMMGFYPTLILMKPYVETEIMPRLAKPYEVKTGITLAYQRPKSRQLYEEEDPKVTMSIDRKVWRRHRCRFDASDKTLLG